jgi:hypothetical protein
MQQLAYQEALQVSLQEQIQQFLYMQQQQQQCWPNGQEQMVAAAAGGGCPDAAAYLQLQQLLQCQQQVMHGMQPDAAASEYGYHAQQQWQYQQQYQQQQQPNGVYGTAPDLCTAMSGQQGAAAAPAAALVGPAAALLQRQCSLPLNGVTLSSADDAAAAAAAVADLHMSAADVEELLQGC